MGVSLSIQGSSSGGRVSGNSLTASSSSSGSAFSISLISSQTSCCVSISGRASLSAAVDWGWTRECWLLVFEGLFLSRGGGTGLDCEDSLAIVLGLAKTGDFSPGASFSVSVATDVLVCAGGEEYILFSTMVCSGLLRGEGPRLLPGVCSEYGEGERPGISVSPLSSLFLVSGVFGTETAVGGSSTSFRRREERMSSARKERGRGKSFFFSSGDLSAIPPGKWEGDSELSLLPRLKRSKKLLFPLAITVLCVPTGREAIGSAARCGDGERCRVMVKAFLNESHFLIFVNFFVLRRPLWK